MADRSPLRVVTAFPELTTPCGDDMNGVALLRRAQRRGIGVEHEVIHPWQELPPGDIYLLGGSGTAGLADLVSRLRRSAVFPDAVSDGAVVLAVDAGLDAISHGLVDDNGSPLVEGLGVVDVTVAAGPARDGSVVTCPEPALGLPAMCGWVQHHARLRPGPGVPPFVQLEVGPGDRDGCDGVRAGRIIGTRLHGPLLARNPELADLLLAWALGSEPGDLPPLPVGAAEHAREQRIQEERGTASTRPPAGRFGSMLRRHWRHAGP